MQSAFSAPLFLSLLRTLHSRAVLGLSSRSWARSPEGTCSALFWWLNLGQNSGLLLQVWSEDRQPWDLLGTYQKCRTSALPQSHCMCTSPGVQEALAWKSALSPLPCHATPYHSMLHLRLPEMVPIIFSTLLASRVYPPLGLY